MRYSFALAALGAAAVLASDVHELKTDTFKDFVKDNDLVLAECESPSSWVPYLYAQELTAVSQSSPPGVVTARPLPPSTRKPPQR